MSVAVAAYLGAGVLAWAVLCVVLWPVARRALARSRTASVPPQRASGGLVSGERLLAGDVGGPDQLRRGRNPLAPYAVKPPAPPAQRGEVLNGLTTAVQTTPRPAPPPAANPSTT